jgi:hypothetical protein
MKRHPSLLTSLLAISTLVLGASCKPVDRLDARSKGSSAAGWNNPVPTDTTGTPLDATQATNPATTAGGTTSAKCSATSEICYEYSNIPSSDLNSITTLCSQIRGTLAAGQTCPSENRAGGCAQTTAGSDMAQRFVVWYYSPKYDPSKVKEQCSKQGVGFVQN